MTSPSLPYDSRKSAPARGIFPDDWDTRQRVQEILFRIETDRVLEHQYRRSVIRKIPF